MMKREHISYYIESKALLERGKFNLRKFITNRACLQRRIDKTEGVVHSERISECKVLGVSWRVSSDELVFNPTDVYN